jgi:uncharacterized repeat protein (TIGR03803 family)
MKRLLSIALLLASALPALTQSATQTVLHTFCSAVAGISCTDGSGPVGDLIQASDGNLYGVTQTGGAHAAGSIFSLTLSGTLATVYSFCSQANCADGQQPAAGVIEGADGNLYGTTRLGGANNAGVIFRLTRSGVFSTLYSFCSQANCADGQWPHAALLQDSSGNLYGTAQYGGVNSAGTLFQLTPAGNLNVLHAFCSVAGCADGALPAGALLQAANGTAYGTTAGKGNGGTIFQITPSGTFTTLHVFCTAANCPDGKSPAGRLVQAADGNLYGTTQYGGANSSQGTVFQLTPSGGFNTVYSFCALAACADGANPASGLFAGSDGNLYGTTENGGANLDGSLFRVASGGTVTTVYSLCSAANCADGAYVLSGLVQASDGNVYSASLGGGNTQYAGVVFALKASPALAAPVMLSTNAAAAHVGKPVTITWSVANAFSQTMKSCEGFVNGSPYQAAGPQGSMTLTPAAAGTLNLALTCGGVESGFLTLTVQP